MIDELNPIEAHQLLTGKTYYEEGRKGGRQYKSIARPILEYYLATKAITFDQYRAGNKLFSTWKVGHPQAYAQARYNEGSDATVTEFMPIGFLAIEYRAAMNAIRGQNEKEAARMVCVEDLPANRCFRHMSIATAKRRGMLYLRSALDDLCEHFF